MGISTFVMQFPDKCAISQITKTNWHAENLWGTPGKLSAYPQLVIQPWIHTYIHEWYANRQVWRLRILGMALLFKVSSNLYIIFTTPSSSTCKWVQFNTSHGSMSLPQADDTASKSKFKLTMAWTLILLDLITTCGHWNQRSQNISKTIHAMAYFIVQLRENNGTSTGIWG